MLNKYLYLKGDDILTRITVYDIEAEALEKIADDNDTNVAEVVEALMQYAEEMKKDNGWR